ncbi:beta-galactosidase-like [Haemaphysalis longicornis]
MVSIWGLCAAKGNRSISIDHSQKQFLKDGQPFRFVAGELHYFRVPPEYWKDRLYKMRMAGLNVVSFYVEWSGHEPEPGQYNFEGMYDLDEFLVQVKEQGLLAIARPGPYICGERDNGGLPYWLMSKHPNMKYRRIDREFLDETDRWFAKLGEVLRPHTYHNGGPIIAVQVEHQYGYYGVCDHIYMEHMLTTLEVRVGRDVVFFRGGPVVSEQYACDKVRRLLATGYMTPNQSPASLKPVIDAAQNKPSPMVISEYYTGGMDYWGYEHVWRKRETVVETLKALLQLNASVSLYMFHGGTNFGFTAGKSLGHALVTSYDYGAPLDEAGDPTPLYHDIRNLIQNLSYLELPSGEPPGASEKLNLGVVTLDAYASLDDVMEHFRTHNWTKRKESELPLTFEDFGQGLGFVLYSTTVQIVTAATANLQLLQFADRAYVYDKNSTSYIFRTIPTASLQVPASKGERLSVLVENMGREAYTKTFKDPKGFTTANLNNIPLKNWTIESVPLSSVEDIDRIRETLQVTETTRVTGFYGGSFTLAEGQQPLDTFLDPTNWTKGVAFINGINLGRYWPVSGPQITLYVPAPFLKPHPEKNHVMLFEIEGAPTGFRSVKFVDKPLLNASIATPRP